MLITSKYNGRCTECGGAISVGETVSWNHKQKGVKHALCSEEGKERAKAVEASRAVDSNVTIPAPRGLAYLPYQRAGIAYALAKSGTLLGDEMGLGKTIQAIGILNARTDIKSVLIITPKSLTLNWMRELTKWLVRDFVVSRNPASGADVIVCSYEEAKKHEVFLAERSWGCLVVDEAHWIKNEKAQRSKCVHNIAQRAAVRLALTGTPISNRPIELFSLLKLVAPETWDRDGKGFFPFAKRYTAATRNRYGWDFSGASNLPELQERLRSTCMVRRLKKDVLTELPPKRRQIVELDVNGASSAVRAEVEAFDSIGEKLTSLRAKVELAKADSNEAYVNAVESLSLATKQAFIEIARLRHVVALCKAPKVVDHVRLALEDDDDSKIVIFAHHRDVIAKISEALVEFGVVTMAGEDKAEERQAVVDRFQNDPKCRVFVGSITASGTGITLTASSHVVFAELTYTPSDMLQAEDRTHRIGQRNSVLVQQLVLDGSLDARMAKILLEKQETLDRGLDVETVVVPVVPTADEAATQSSRRNQIQELSLKMDASVVAHVHAALRQLSGMCDGARSLDGAGFNKIDTYVGKSLASLPTLNNRQAALGYLICRKYHKQIGEISLKDSP